MSLGKPWSNNPYAPPIPSLLYIEEKTNFAVYPVAAVCYGIVVILFFECMSTLLNPPDRTTGGRIKWSLLAHTVTMFLFATINIAMGMALQSTSNVDNRGFPGGEKSPPGPFGYSLLVFSNAITIVPNVLFLLNNWLADGLLLYRCWVLYAMSYRVIAIPSLMYLACVGTGILFVYSNTQPHITSPADILKSNVPYISISIILNILLTLMIVVRLVLHIKNIRGAMSSLVRPDRLYKIIITILVESSSLNAIGFLSFIGSWAVRSPVQNAFIHGLAEIQVIAPFLITLRIANRTALTSDSLVSGNIGSIHFQSTEATDNEPPPDGNTVGSIDAQDLDNQ